MAAKTDYSNKLKELGLNSYEARLWTALLERGTASAGELSDLAGVPRSRSYDVLESLEKKGFVLMKLGKPIQYMAVKPLDVIDRLKKKVNEEASTKTLELETLKESETLQQLNDLHIQGTNTLAPSDLTGALRGHNNLYDHLNWAIKTAKQSIRIATTQEGLKRKAKTLKKSLKKAQAKGVDIRILINSTKDLPDIAGQVRESPELTSRFCVIDEDQVTIMPLGEGEASQESDLGIWASTPFAAKGFRTIFDKFWKDAA